MVSQVPSYGYEVWDFDDRKQIEVFHMVLLQAATQT